MLTGHPEAYSCTQSNATRARSVGQRHSVYLRADVFPAQQADRKPEESHHSPLHQEAALSGVDTEVIEMVAHRLPHA